MVRNIVLMVAGLGLVLTLLTGGPGVLIGLAVLGVGLAGALAPA